MIDDMAQRGEKNAGITRSNIEEKQLLGDDFHRVEIVVSDDAEELRAVPRAGLENGGHMTSVAENGTPHFDSALSIHDAKLRPRPLQPTMIVSPAKHQMIAGAKILWSEFAIGFHNQATRAHDVIAEAEACDSLRFVPENALLAWIGGSGVADDDSLAEEIKKTPAARWLKHG